MNECRKAKAAEKYRGRSAASVAREDRDEHDAEPERFAAETTARRIMATAINRQPHTIDRLAIGETE
jgi:hypothetical protein